MNRRFFLKSSGISLASFGALAATPCVLQNTVFARSEELRKKVLVIIFQRGAVDGLNMFVPHGSREYYEYRKTIAVPQPGKNSGAIDLDGYFGLNPSMESFRPLWQQKQLAIVHSVGSPDNTRSHFDAHDYMESGTPGTKSTRDGWMNRMLESDARKDDSPFRAVSMTTQIPRSLMGHYPTIAMTDLNSFAIRAGKYSGSVSGGFEGIWQQQADNELGETGKETFEAINFLKRANPAKYKVEHNAKYPAGEFSRNLRQIAQLIKANVGLETAFTDTPGLNWDTHANQAGAGGGVGQLANLLRTFSDSISAFAIDLGKQMDDVVVVTMSEFGRTARENGTRGTDHGHGNSMMIIGNGVNGGIYGNWKGLRSDELYQDRDLAVTTDFRDVLGELVSKQLNKKNSANIFPGYALRASNFKGILR
ncbi:MAG: DUF1501 domain-containing protein [Pyrinomonadaceae bacterium]